MKEIRLHGRGGQGVIKASQLIVAAAVARKEYGQSIPFFGVERKGSPVFVYLRLSNTEPIRRKTQVYEPDIIVILDDTLVQNHVTYDGLKEGGTLIINSTKDISMLNVPEQAGVVALIDATGISEDLLGRNRPNSPIVGAFAKVTGLVDRELILREVENAFGSKNRTCAERAFDEVKIVKEV